MTIEVGARVRDRWGGSKVWLVVGEVYWSSRRYLYLLNEETGQTYEARERAFVPA